MTSREGPDSNWTRWTGKIVVVDTDSSFVYIGTFVSADPTFIRLAAADVHDRRETPTTKERYVLDTKRFGVTANRREVAIRRDMVVSLSLLDDIVEY